MMVKFSYKIRRWEKTTKRTARKGPDRFTSNEEIDAFCDYVIADIEKLRKEWKQVQNKEDIENA